MKLTPPMVSVATSAALEAGRQLKRRQGTAFRISKKDRTNLVTEVDLEAEGIIVDRIHSRFPEHQILAEERGLSGTDSSFRWIVDPLDGTTNYAHGYRFFCVSIGLEIDRDLRLGVVYDPVTEELFTAEKGQGARLNGQPIRVSSQDVLVDSLVATGFSYDRERMRRNLDLFDRVMMEVRAIRRDGAAALDLCYVACGRFDAFWELHLSPWDVAAGKLIVEEAGGRVTDLRGQGWQVGPGEVLASNGALHLAFLELIRTDSPNSR